MRLLILFLILANAGYFVWSLYSEPGVVSEQPAFLIPEGVQRLELVSEANEEIVSEPEIQTIQQEASQTETVEVAQVEPVMCWTLGPFRDEALSDSIMDKMTENGFKPESRAIEQKETSGYWVYLPAYESRQEAKSVAEKLAERGIKDYYVVTGEENRNAISLGLFSTKARADRRKADIRRFGYRPRSEIRYRDRTYFWIDYDEQGSRQLPGDLWSLVEGDLPQRLKRECN